MVHITEQNALQGSLSQPQMIGQQKGIGDSMNPVAVLGLGATVSAIAGFSPPVLNLPLHPTPPPYLIKPPANAQALRLQGVAHL